MKKIPVKIVEITSPSGKIAKDVMIDVYDYMEMKGNVQQKIKEFKKKYFATVDKAIKIMPKKKTDRKPSHFWKIGKLLLDFNKSIKNEFDITNYNQAIIRDFGLYNRSVVGHTLQFGEFFNEKDLSNNIPMSHYIELIWKANMLKELGIFEKEKKQLLKLAQKNQLPPHKEYREKLNKLTKSKPEKIKA